MIHSSFSIQGHIDKGSQEPPKELMQAAKDLEATFAFEMLQAAGFGESDGSFSGGAGEDHFKSFLLREHAKVLTESGALNLAEHLFTALQRTQTET